MSEMPFNSYSILSDLVDLEKTIRLGNTEMLSQSYLDVYWREIFELLGTYSIYKNPELGVVDKIREINIIKSRVKNTGYHQFITKKLNELESKASK